MSSKKNIPAILLLLFIMYCINEYNPFNDPSNAEIEIISQTFDPDSVAIFDAETVVVRVAFPELVESFSIHAEKNRFWHDSTIANEHFSASHRFIFSFRDIGSTDIQITVMPYNAKAKVKLIKLLCYSPLHQDSIAGFGQYGDSVCVNTLPVSDHDIEYFWRFNNTVKHSFKNCDTFWIDRYDSLENTGSLWVQDTAGNRSPEVSFPYTLNDLRPPSITSATENFIFADTIIAGANQFAFKVKIEDRGAGGVDYASINGEKFDFKSIDNIYTKYYLTMSDYEFQPLEAVVEARDKNQNDTVKKFILFYDSSNIQTNTITITLGSVNQTSITTSVKELTVIGEAVSIKPEKYTLEFYLNKTHLVDYDTTIYHQGPWGCFVSLQGDSINDFTVYGKIGDDTLGKLAVSIIYNSSLIDTAGPVLSRVFIDKDAYSPGMIVANSKVTATIYAYDMGSGVKDVFLDGVAAQIDAQKITWHLPLTLKPKNNGIAVLLVDNKDNRSRPDTLRIVENKLPELSIAPDLPYYLVAGVTYRDTVRTRDLDGDSVVLKLKSVNNGLKFSSLKTGNITRYFLTWRPEMVDTGVDTLSFRLYDNIQYTSVYSWPHKIVKDPVNVTAVAFQTTSADLPGLLIVDSITLDDTLKVRAGTGSAPFTFSARLFPEDTLIMPSSNSPVVTWEPSEQDIGNHLLVCVVEDNNDSTDTLFHTMMVIPKNQFPCSLTVKEISGKNLLSGGKLLTLKSSSDTALLHFHIVDTDNPLLEHYVITRTLANISTSFETDSSDFYITIVPKLNAPNDTLQVTVKDQTGARSESSIRIVIDHPILINTDPNDYDSLFLWLNAEDNAKIALMPPESLILTWYSSQTGSDKYVISGGYAPSYDQLDVYPHAQFGRYGKEHLENYNFKPTNSSYTVFVVARLASIAGGGRRTLVSLTDLQNGHLYFGATDNTMGAYFTSITNMTTNTFASSLTFTKDVWHIFTYVADRPPAAMLVINQRLDGRISGGLSSSLNLQIPQELMIGAMGVQNNNAEFYSTWSGDMAEILVYNRKLSNQEIQELELYLSMRYNIPIQK